MKRTKFLLPCGFKPVGYVLLALGLVAMGVFNWLHVDFTLNQLMVALFGEGARQGGSLTVDVGSGLPSDSFADAGLMFTISGLLIVLGCLFAGFSRFEEEDEYLEQLRYESLLLSLFIYLVALLVLLLFVWGLAFLVWSAIGLFAALVFYVVCLTVRVAIARKSLSHEE